MLGRASPGFVLASPLRPVESEARNVKRGEKDTGLRPLVVMARFACRGRVGENGVHFELPARSSDAILQGLPLAC